MPGMRPSSANMMDDGTPRAAATLTARRPSYRDKVLTAQHALHDCRACTATMLAVLLFGWTQCWVAHLLYVASAVLRCPAASLYIWVLLNALVLLRSVR